MAQPVKFLPLARYGLRVLGLRSQGESACPSAPSLVLPFSLKQINKIFLKMYFSLLQVKTTLGCRYYYCHHLCFTYRQGDLESLGDLLKISEFLRGNIRILTWTFSFRDSVLNH